LVISILSPVIATKSLGSSIFQDKSSLISKIYLASEVSLAPQTVFLKSSIEAAKELRRIKKINMKIKEDTTSLDEIPLMDLSEEEIQNIGDQLAEFHKIFHYYYSRSEQFPLGYAYLCGLLSNLSEKSGMITTDSREFSKKDKESVGVIRQYCGRFGIQMFSGKSTGRHPI